MKNLIKKAKGLGLSLEEVNGKYKAFIPGIPQSGGIFESLQALEEYLETELVREKEMNRIDLVEIDIEAEFGDI